MDDNNVIDNGLVDVFHAEDTIFNNCMNDFNDFPKYITHYDDIKGRFSNKFMSKAFKNLNLDAVFERRNGKLVNLEHHSGPVPMRRNYSFVVTVFEASGLSIESFIFNTGKIPKKQVEYLNDTMFYNPKFFNTFEIRGIVNLNNFRYKVTDKEELNQFDALDLIWLVKTNIDIDLESLLMELTDIWANAVAPKWILSSIRKNMIIWAKKFIVDEENIKKFKKVIRMSRTEVISFDEAMKGAAISGELYRAEKKGMMKVRGVLFLFC